MFGENASATVFVEFIKELVSEIGVSAILLHDYFTTFVLLEALFTILDGVDTVTMDRVLLLCGTTRERLNSFYAIISNRLGYGSTLLKKITQKEIFPTSHEKPLITRIVYMLMAISKASPICPPEPLEWEHPPTKVKHISDDVAVTLDSDQLYTVLNLTSSVMRIPSTNGFCDLHFAHNHLPQAILWRFYYPILRQLRLKPTKCGASYALKAAAQIEAEYQFTVTEMNRRADKLKSNNQASQAKHLSWIAPTRLSFLDDENLVNYMRILKLMLQPPNIVMARWEEHSGRISDAAYRYCRVLKNYNFCCASAVEAIFNRLIQPHSIISDLFFLKMGFTDKVNNEDMLDSQTKDLQMQTKGRRLLETYLARMYTVLSPPDIQDYPWNEANPHAIFVEGDDLAMTEYPKGSRKLSSSAEETIMDDTAFKKKAQGSCVSNFEIFKGKKEDGPVKAVLNKKCFVVKVCFIPLWMLLLRQVRLQFYRRNYIGMREAALATLSFGGPTARFSGEAFSTSEGSLSEDYASEDSVFHSATVERRTEFGQHITFPPTASTKAGTHYDMLATKLIFTPEQDIGEPLGQYERPVFILCAFLYYILSLALCNDGEQLQELARSMVAGDTFLKKTHYTSGSLFVAVNRHTRLALALAPFLPLRDESAQCVTVDTLSILQESTFVEKSVQCLENNPLVRFTLALSKYVNGDYKMAIFYFNWFLKMFDSCRDIQRDEADLDDHSAVDPEDDNKDSSYAEITNFISPGDWAAGTFLLPYARLGLAHSLMQQKELLSTAPLYEKLALTYQHVTEFWIYYYETLAAHYKDFKSGSICYEESKWGISDNIKCLQEYFHLLVLWMKRTKHAYFKYLVRPLLFDVGLNKTGKIILPLSVTYIGTLPSGCTNALTGESQLTLLLNDLGVYYYYLNQPAIALFYMAEALASVTKTKSPMWEEMLLEKRLKKDLRELIKSPLFLKGIREKPFPANAACDKRFANIYFNIGSVLRLLGAFDVAVYYLHIYCFGVPPPEINTSTNTMRNKTSILSSPQDAVDAVVELGFAYHLAGELDLAIYYYEEGLRMRSIFRLGNHSATDMLQHAIDEQYKNGYIHRYVKEVSLPVAVLDPEDPSGPTTPKATNKPDPEPEVLRAHVHRTRRQRNPSRFSGLDNNEGERLF